MPRRNVLQPRLTVRTVEQQRACQLGLPSPALNTAGGNGGDGSVGVETLFDADSLAAFEHKLKNGIVEPDHPHPAMQETDFNGGIMQDPAQARFHGLASDLEQFYPTAPPPTNPKIVTESLTPPYTPSWRTTHRNSNK